MTFGERLRCARKEKGLTQKELALKINAAHNSISNWENNQNMPDPDTIQHLCWALDVQPNYFFSVDSPNPKTGTGLLVGSVQKDENIIRIAGRDGSFVERRLTDSELAAFKAMLDALPEAPDDL